MANLKSVISKYCPQEYVMDQSEVIFNTLYSMIDTNTLGKVPIVFELISSLDQVD
jgi:hypothetical protein